MYDVQSKASNILNKKTIYKYKSILIRKIRLARNQINILKSPNLMLFSNLSLVRVHGGFHLYLSDLAFINQFYFIMTRLVQLSLTND